MEKFALYVPQSMRSNDQQTMRMEFYIQLYFFVVGVQGQLVRRRSIDSKAKLSFIAYLEGRGAPLVKLR